MVDKLMALPDTSAPRVVLIRHGESEDNLVMNRVRDEVRSGGSVRAAVTRYMQERVEDPRLSEVGRRQAEAMGEYWGSAWGGEVEVWCGPMMRNLETMRELVGRMKEGVRVVCQRDIFELQGVVSKSGVGKPAGLSIDEIKRMFPEVTEFNGFGTIPTTSPWNQRGYEPRAAQESRIRNVTSEILSLGADPSRKNTTTIIISHADFQSHLVASLLRLPNALSKTHRTFIFKNTSVTSFRVFPSGDITIEELDNTMHLHTTPKL